MRAFTFLSVVIHCVSKKAAIRAFKFLSLIIHYIN